MATRPTHSPLPTHHQACVEPILHDEDQEITLLVAHELLTITRAQAVAGWQVAGSHIHHSHTDSFYVLAGRLVFEIGRERETITASAGTFISVPPEVAHSFHVDSQQPAHWLTLHTPDGGFADFIRSIGTGIKVDWDIAPVPTDGGLPANSATIRAGALPIPGSGE